jgi:pyridoxine 5-phosphate synthase
MKALRLGVNVDHVATVRNARGGEVPDPVRAALMAIEAGADGITAHLREDRRHILDDDMVRLKASISKPLNFEMAATEPMLDIALKIRPHACCLVPEKRTERTTEGGLDVVGGFKALKPFVDELTREGIRVSMFIEPSPEALKASAELGAPVVELHTGAWCDARARGEAAKADHEFSRLTLAAAQSQALGLECHAGHGLDYDTARMIAALPQIVELNIGHFLVGEARGVRPWSAGFDHRHRQRPLRHRAHRGDARAARRALYSPLLHSDRTAPLGSTRRARGFLRQTIRRQGGLRQSVGHGTETGGVLARHGRH